MGRTESHDEAPFFWQGQNGVSTVETVGRKLSRLVGPEVNDWNALQML